MFEEYFRSDITGNVYYKRVLFEGFICWYQRDHSNKIWILLTGVDDKHMNYKNLTKISKSELFVELL